MFNIFSFIRNHICVTVERLFPGYIVSDNIILEIPSNPKYGDFSTNAGRIVSMQIPNADSQIVEELRKLDFIDKISIADGASGFINIIVKKNFWIDFLKSAYQIKNEYGFVNIGQNEKINIEFVSANPTGPLHIGHARGAIYGDTIARILEKVGFDVTREYYINDAGNQIEKLVRSLKIRYQNLHGAALEIPEGCYPGEYLIDIAQKLNASLTTDINAVDERQLADFAVEQILMIIKQDLSDLGVITHNVFTSEFHDIVEKGKIEQSIAIIQNKGLLYKGTLAAPKGTENADWEPTEQTIFRSTAFGDSEDRVVVKSNGEYTYFAGDIAYHHDKIARGYKKMILLLGMDHAGYIKRINSIVQALSDGQAAIDIKTTQLVGLYKDGVPYKMSKRAGNFLTVADVLKEVGKDNLRFAMLTKASDTGIVIDFSKLKEQNKHNAIWYIQYAHTRAKSVLNKAAEMFDMSVAFDIDTDNMAHMILAEDMNLIKMIASYPKIIMAAACNHEPHRISYYLQELASIFHHLWAAGTTEKTLRFIDTVNIENTKYRLMLVKLTATIISSGLELLGIEALESM